MGCTTVNLQSQASTPMDKFLQTNHNLDLFKHQIYFNIEILKNVNSQNISEILKQTVKSIYTNLSNKIFEQYSKHHQQYSRIRLLYCSVIKTIKAELKQSWMQHAVYIFEIINRQSIAILAELLKKYPVIRNNSKNSNIGNTIPSFNNLYDPKYDVFKDPKLQFFTMDNAEQNTYLSKGQMSKIYKLFINVLINQSRNQFTFFEGVMKNIFTEKVHGLIGCKFSDKVQAYTEKQLEDPIFVFKSPQVLRVFIKWIESLEEDFEKQSAVARTKFNIVKHLKPFEETKTKVVEIKLQQPDEIADFIEKVNQIRQFIDSQAQTTVVGRYQLYCNYIEKINNAANKQPFQETTIQMCEFLISIANSLTTYTLESLKVLWVNALILSDNGAFDQIEKYFNMRSFKISDLLRAKCEGTQDQIMGVYTRLKQCQQIQLVRVKNRLNLGTKDMLINFKIKNSFLLCQLQLAVVNEQADQLGYFECKFNHFLYELKRSTFGPLTQCSMILYFEDPRFYLWPQLRKSLKFNEIINYPTLPFTYVPNDGMSRYSKQIMKCPRNHEMQDFYSYPFYCNLCSKWLNIQISQYDNYRCYTCKKCILSVCHPCCKIHINGFAKAVQT